MDGAEEGRGLLTRVFFTRQLLQATCTPTRFRLDGSSELSGADDSDVEWESAGAGRRGGYFLGMVSSGRRVGSSQRKIQQGEMNMAERRW